MPRPDLVPLVGYRCTICGADVVYEVGCYVCECADGVLDEERYLRRLSHVPERWEKREENEHDH